MEHIWMITEIMEGSVFDLIIAARDLYTEKTIKYILFHGILEACSSVYLIIFRDYIKILWLLHSIIVFVYLHSTIAHIICVFTGCKQRPC